MTILKRIHRDSLFVLVVRVFALCLLPLLIFQTAMFSWARNAVWNELKDSASMRLKNLQESFEARSHSMVIAAQYIAKAPKFQEFLVYQNVYSTSAYYDNINALFELLKNYRLANPTISSIRLYFPQIDLGLILTSNTIIVRPNQNELQTKIKSSTRVLNYQFFGGEHMVCASYPFALGKGDELPLIYVEVLTDDEKISELLKFATTKQCYTSFMFDENAENFLFDRYIRMEERDVQQLKNAVNQWKREEGSILDLRLSDDRYKLLLSYSQATKQIFGQLLYANDFETIPSRFVIYLSVFWLMAILAMAFLCAYIHQRVANPTKQLLEAFESVGTGDFNTHIPDVFKIREYNRLREHFNRMNSQIRNLVHTNYEMKIAVQDAELKHLQSKVNPHFLYNSLHLLRFMIHYGDMPQTDQFIECLGRYFQYISSNADGMTHLAQEYENAVDYLTIQSMRFEDRIRLEIAPLPEELKHFKIPCLILQPVLENIIKYCKPADGEPIIIRTCFLRISGAFTIKVEDNGRSVTDERIQALNQEILAPDNMHALSNISKRMHIAYSYNNNLRIARGGLGGFCVLLTFPALEELARCQKEAE
mgnify:CR=1 FL=1